jgi:hypothetical protein
MTIVERLQRTGIRRIGTPLAALALLVLPLGGAACAPGAPPPGPIDLIRKAIDPSYDYTESPDTWRGADQDDDGYRRHARRDGWHSGCPEDDLTCTHDGVTVCCAPRDRCCAGRDGPYCCDADGAGYGADGGRWYDDR